MQEGKDRFKFKRKGLKSPFLLYCEIKVLNYSITCMVATFRPN